MRKKILKEFARNGFAILENIYSADEVHSIVQHIESADSNKATFRKSADLFAIRQFLKELPELIPIIFNATLKTVLHAVFGSSYFAVKSIYFDKPPASNWYVSWHQDLTISVNKKAAIDGYYNWTTKQNQYAVQPPVAILENIVTVRIHLDDTTENNGALKVIPQSHTKGIYRPETIDWKQETAISCPVSKGGVMLMKPLLLHSSGRTVNEQQRRVIHIEFSSISLPATFQWSEFLQVP